MPQPHRRNPLLAAVVALLPAFLSAWGKSKPDKCEATSASPAGAIKVGLITKTETNPFFVKMKEGAQKAASEQGAVLMTASGKFDGDNESQVTAIENMIAAGVKGIL